MPRNSGDRYQTETSRNGSDDEYQPGANLDTSRTSGGADDSNFFDQYIRGSLQQEIQKDNHTKDTQLKAKQEVLPHEATKQDNYNSKFSFTAEPEIQSFREKREPSKNSQIDLNNRLKAAKNPDPPIFGFNREDLSTNRLLDTPISHASFGNKDDQSEYKRQPIIDTDLKPTTKNIFRDFNSSRTESNLQASFSKEASVEDDEDEYPGYNYNNTQYHGDSFNDKKQKSGQRHLAKQSKTSQAQEQDYISIEVDEASNTSFSMSLVNKSYKQPSSTNSPQKRSIQGVSKGSNHLKLINDLNEEVDTFISKKQ